MNIILQNYDTHRLAEMGKELPGQKPYSSFPLIG